MQALGSEHIALDQVEERHDDEGSVADLVSERRQWQVDPSHFKRALWRLSGISMPKLSNRIVASIADR